eukprot:2154154-Rhodomonas_salina.1
MASAAFVCSSSCRSFSISSAEPGAGVATLDLSSAEISAIGRFRDAQSLASVSLLSLTTVLVVESERVELGDSSSS